MLGYLMPNQFFKELYDFKRLLNNRLTEYFV